VGRRQHARRRAERRDLDDPLRRLRVRELLRGLLEVHHDRPWRLEPWRGSRPCWPRSSRLRLCARPGGRSGAPPSGLLFSYQSAPLETDFDATPVGSKKGEAEVHFLREPFFTSLPLATWGDASLAAAAQEGGIQTVHYVDYTVLSVLGIYVQLTVEVSGD
jgi:hypothetical protein